MLKKLKNLPVKKQWAAGISTALVLVLLVCGLYAIGHSAQKPETKEADRVKKTSSTKKISQKSEESSSDKKDDSLLQSSSSDNGQPSANQSSSQQGGTSASTGNQTNSGATYQAPATSSNASQSNNTTTARSYQAPAQQPSTQQPAASAPAQQAHKWTFVASDGHKELYRQGGFNTEDEAYSAGADYMASHIEVFRYNVY